MSENHPASPPMRRKAEVSGTWPSEPLPHDRTTRLVSTSHSRLTASATRADSRAVTLPVPTNASRAWAWERPGVTSEAREASAAITIALADEVIGDGLDHFLGGLDRLGVHFIGPLGRDHVHHLLHDLDV